MYAAHQKGTCPNFRQRPLSDIDNSTLQCWCAQTRAIDIALVQPSERYIEEKQTELETESKL